MRVSDANSHVFTSVCGTDRRLWRGEVKRGEGLESGVICQITSTNLKPFHRESNSETTDGGLCYTHARANTHSQALTLQNPSNRDDSRSRKSQGSNKHSRHTSYVCHAGGW